MGETEKCHSCGRVVGPKMRLCQHCGWDNAQKARLCVKCEGNIVLHNGMGANGAAGGGTGIGGFIMVWFLGLLLSLTIMFGFATLLGIGSVFTMGYKCLGCDKPVPDALLSPDEKSAKAKRRVGLIAMSAGLGVASILCLVLWITLVKSRLSGD